MSTGGGGGDSVDATTVAAAGAVMDSDISQAEGMVRKTGAGAYEAIKTNFSASAAPTTGDDSADGYAVGSRWIDTTADKEYVCLDATEGAAVWTETTGSGAAVTWLDWVTISDFDNGATPASDPNSLLNSLTEPAAGELLFDWDNGAGAVRDGSDEGVRFEISHSIGGYFDASNMVGDGSDIIAFQFERVSAVSDATTDPIVAFGITDGTTPGWVGIEHSTTENATIIVGGASSNSTTGQTVAPFEKMIGAIMAPMAKASPGTPSATAFMQMLGLPITTSDDVENNAYYEEYQQIGVLHSFASDPTSWVLFVFLGNDSASAGSQTYRLRFRIGIASWRAAA